MLTKDLHIKSFGRSLYPPSKKQDKPLKKTWGCYPFGLEHQKVENTVMYQTCGMNDYRITLNI